MPPIGLRCFLLALAFAIAGLSACRGTPPEAQLRAQMQRVQDALEARDVGGLRAVLADDFVGPEGLDRAGAARLAQGAFLRYRDVGLTFGPLDITLRDDFATVRFTAAARGGAGGLLEQSAQVYDVETGWRRIDDEWLLTSARWEPKL